MREVSEDQRSPINVRVFRVRGVTYRACLDGSVGAMCPCARVGTGTVDLLLPRHCCSTGLFWPDRVMSMLKVDYKKHTE